MSIVVANAISASAIALYRRYDGDGDGFSRSADRDAGVSEQDWRTIDDLRQRAFIVATGRGSEEFRRVFESDFAVRIRDDRARNEFQLLVDGDLKASAERDIRSAREMSAIVEAEIAKITQPELASRIRELLVPVRCEQRGWDYGRPDEEYPCWIFAEHSESNTAFVYTQHGFGPSSPWGLLFIRGPHMSMGMDSSWFISVEDLFRDSKAWSGVNPPGYAAG